MQSPPKLGMTKIDITYYIFIDLWHNELNNEAFIFNAQRNSIDTFQFIWERNHAIVESKQFVKQL